MDNVSTKIYFIRGLQVMLDQDLAELYQVETKVLNQAVKRNLGRFPHDFMFQLVDYEFQNLKSQFVTSSWGGKRKLPLVFTEQGVAMLSGLLKSQVAVEVNIRIMRAFVELRRLIAVQPEYALLKETIKQIESRMDSMGADHLVDNATLSHKMSQLSSEVRRLSEAFDQFQEAHIVIKRPEEGGSNG
jgi:hypothetical protein